MIQNCRLIVVNKGKESSECECVYKERNNKKEMYETERAKAQQM